MDKKSVIAFVLINCSAAVWASKDNQLQTKIIITDHTAIMYEKVEKNISRALPASTLIAVTPNEEISSKNVKVGQAFSFSVVEDVVEKGVIVIPRGVQVMAVISWKTGRAVGGKSGKFELKFEKITVGTKDYALRGLYRQEGKGNTAGALFGSLLISGRSAILLPGQVIHALTAEAIPF